jgi:peptide/nickel transport system substrate-binding protein
MIFLKRKRLLIWLLKAYIRRWKRTIFLSFIAGSIFFVILYIFSSLFVDISPFKGKEVIGILGSYTRDNLPPEVASKIGKGLTALGEDGIARPDLAKSWVIRDNGKTYIFYLKRDMFFSDKTRLTSDLVNYNFIDVVLEKPDEDTVVFKLKDSYAPFLVTVSRPILKKNYVGIGEYKLTSIDLNGDFVRSVELTSKNDKLIYQFYPTENSLKIAFLLGEISRIEGISDLNFLGTSLSSFSGFKIDREINFSKLATLFYNTKDAVLSDERMRRALSYGIPDEFNYGERSRIPYPPNLWATSSGYDYIQDLDHAKLLISQTEATKSGKLTLTIKSLKKYKNTALDIKKSWDKIGINTKIEEVDSFPQDFQIFLGEFNIPKDPDQYMIWHSTQATNITGYKNLRIDKLLEDGRRTTDVNERRRIYADFQKYILDDPPATFLYFPNFYIVSRR